MLLKIREESSLSVHKWRFIRPGWLKNSPSACSSLSKDRGCLEKRYFLMLVSHVGAEATVIVCLGQTCRRPGCAPRAQWEPERMQAAGIHLPQQNNFSSVQFSRSVVSDSATPWIAARQASLSITNSRSSLKLTSIESVMPSSHLILCCPLLLLPLCYQNTKHQTMKEKGTIEI